MELVLSNRLYRITSVALSLFPRCNFLLKNGRTGNWIVVGLVLNGVASLSVQGTTWGYETS